MGQISSLPGSARRLECPPTLCRSWPKRPAVMESPQSGWLLERKVSVKIVMVHLSMGGDCPTPYPDGCIMALAHEQRCLHYPEKAQVDVLRMVVLSNWRAISPSTVMILRRNGPISKPRQAGNHAHSSIAEEQTLARLVLLDARERSTDGNLISDNSIPLHHVSYKGFAIDVQRSKDTEYRWTAT
jgi:hypothetical protein